MSIYYNPDLLTRLTGISAGHMTAAEFKALLPEVRLFQYGDKVKDRFVTKVGEVFLGGRICHQMVTFDMGDGNIRACMEIVAVFGDPPSTIDGFNKAVAKLEQAMAFYENAKTDPHLIDPLTFDPMTDEARADYLKTCLKTITRLKAEMEEAAERLPPGP